MAEFEENCTHSCETCSADCASRQGEQKDPHEKMHEGCSVKKVIGVVSGKGGVGKSMVTALSAIAANRNGLKTGILDADITGPSIPKMFGIHEKAEVSNMGLLPASTPTEMEIMSLNLLTDNETDPVIWRGPVIAGAVTQFWTDVIWGDLDVMFIDMPPGTGDVPLTIFQSIPVDGIIIVTSPQELVSMIVEKAMKMAQMMNIPILGMVENMSYLECPDCGSHRCGIRHSGYRKAADRSEAGNAQRRRKNRVPREQGNGCHGGRSGRDGSGNLKNTIQKIILDFLAGSSIIFSV